MKNLFKEIGLILLGALVCYIIILSINLNRRITFLERNIIAITNFLNNNIRRAPQSQLPPQNQEVK